MYPFPFFNVISLNRMASFMNSSLVAYPKCLFSFMKCSTFIMFSFGSLTDCVSKAVIVLLHVCNLPICAISIPGVAVSFLGASSDILIVFILFFSLFSFGLFV